MIDDIKFEKDWLKVERLFNDKYEKSKKWACASNIVSSVMLDTVITPELKLLGLSNEATNKIQQKRKDIGLDIEDDIQVFYEVRDPLLKQMMDKHRDKIQDTIKKPLLSDNLKDPRAELLGEAPMNAENGSAGLVFYICKPCPILVDDKIKNDLLAKPDADGKHMIDSANINMDSVVKALSAVDLKQVTANNNGKVKVKVQVEVELKHGEHFFFDVTDDLYKKK